MAVDVSEWANIVSRTLKDKCVDLMGDTGKTIWESTGSERLYGCLWSHLYTKFVDMTGVYPIITENHKLNVDLFIEHSKKAVSDVISDMSSKTPRVYDTSSKVIELFSKTLPSLLEYIDTREFAEVASNYIGFKDTAEITKEDIRALLDGKVSCKSILDNISYFDIPHTDSVVCSITLFGVGISKVVDCYNCPDAVSKYDYVLDAVYPDVKLYLDVLYNYLNSKR